MCYLKPKIVNENIKELDLTSCYWLKSVDIQKCALKLPNLEAFHVADTSLTTGDLMKVLCSCCKVFTVISTEHIYKAMVFTGVG